jgi:hypothetical protein
MKQLDDKNLKPQVPLYFKWGNLIYPKTTKLKTLILQKEKSCSKCARDADGG